MTVLVWTAIGLLVGGLLLVAWWFDRDARRRGATPLSGATMGADASSRRWEVRRRESQQLLGGATPRGQDAHHGTWRRPGT
ncbi:hypothetical protein SAMN03159343_2910 [Klenkia marina]|uniref:Uncharacterized protein n=1 Tax=Klenkia marina TaxID=1960309 RepID=A0A1G4YHW4_9ACTN|nr:hypothetical protein [Klenkia marina]SCX53066.1 hypothetical protein SAMN03159343_2910 [Klenkia marina]